MSLFEQWQGAAYVERSQQEYDAFWSEYLAAEQKNYESILENKDEKIEGTLKELADRFGMDAVTFTGFLDGINTSLVTALDLDSLTEESSITLDIDLEKLYYNMLDAKAEWLYNLPQWDAILTVEKRKEIKKAFNSTKTVVKDKKVGRNDPCPCGSGKKYKKCCINK